jgi:hypothetical protein
MFMAVDATELAIVGCVSMAVGTGVPFSFMCTGINWKILAVVIAEPGRFPPRIQAVTILAVYRKLKG